MAGRLDAPPTAPTRVDRAKWWLDAVKIEKLYMAPRYAGCLMIGVGTGGVFGCYGAERLRHWLQTLGARPEPVQSGLSVLGVLYSVLLGATLSQGMGRQTAHLNAFGAQIIYGPADARVALVGDNSVERALFEEDVPRMIELPPADI